MNLSLGVIYKDGKVINHRSLLKILINPILRKTFGIEIVTVIKKGMAKELIIRKTKIRKLNWSIFSYNRDYDKIIKKRMIV